ncbi:SLC22A4_5 [Acanthosepion pharaonis]|uniref:SLC22A4_5 n=1 Tax=Acanthosepion pharaonis TaxID=158019 RepID=A0A812AIQ4_ACAPH|nr:SLC22A4_5 [Sepia pharaonis]
MQFSYYVFSQPSEVLVHLFHHVSSIFLNWYNLFFFLHPDLQWTTTLLATISKLCVTGSFAIVFLHTCELYPTCVRNGALGALSTFARFGGVIAPYIMMMRALAAGRFGDSLPLLTMGIVCILAGVSYFFLPETCNRLMNDTFDDLSRRNTGSIREKDEYQLEAKTALNRSI